MNLPYHLNPYKKKIDSLSKQSKSLLEFVVRNNQYEKFYKRIENELFLENQSVEILCSDILRGYYNSIYSYSWGYEEELNFWNLVNSKCDENNKIYFLLASFQNEKYGKITRNELCELYFKAFDQHLDHIFSIEDTKWFYDNEKYRYKFLEYEFKARITQWDDFEDNWGNGQPWIKNFGEDEKAMVIINQMLNEKRKRTDNNGSIP